MVISIDDTHRTITIEDEKMKRVDKMTRICRSMYPGYKIRSGIVDTRSKCNGICNKIYFL